MSTVIGSARHDENGKYANGRAGDQLQKSINDFRGEVSMQYLKDFIGSRKWYILRLKSDAHAHNMALAMKTACNNVNLGYDQNNRLGVMTYGVDTKIKTECDCSSLIRACIKKAVGISVPNFTTVNELAILLATGLFQPAIEYSLSTKVYEGDIFVTKSKGHTGACIEGIARVKAVTNFIYAGVNYNKVFDPVYYGQCNPDVRAAYGNNANMLFNHFITFGINERSRVGKTISTFNVEVYGSHSPDLLKAFGECKEGNYRPFYKHYCTNGYKENRRVI